MTAAKNVTEIIRLLHPADSLWRPVSVLKGYFDDSGTHDGSLVMAIGGCVAREEQWTLFAEEWEKMLETFGISEFHATDLQGFAGEFEPWKDDPTREEKRRSLINEVTRIGMKWAKDSFASLVVRPDYVSEIPQWAKTTAAFGDEYNFCFQMTIGRLMAWIERLHIPMPKTEQIAFVFDQQPKKEGVTRNSFSAIKSFRDPEDRMGALAFASGKRFLPLQFADFIAYEAYKHLDALVSQSGRPQRASFTLLINHRFYLEMSYFGRQDLQALVRDYERKGHPLTASEPWWPWNRHSVLDSQHDANAQSETPQ